MSNLTDDPQPLPQEPTHEPVIAYQDSPSQTITLETQNQPDPPLKSDPEGITPPPPILGSDDNRSVEEEQNEEGEEEEKEGSERGISETPAISSGKRVSVIPLVIEPHVSVSDVSVMSPSNNPTPRNKRKKGKGKSKPNIKKQQAIEEKLQTLTVNLNPIPFIPHKIFDFVKHEKLFKKLGLWDFVHIDFDRKIRVDLIAQLVSTYKPKVRASYVNGFRIMVNRADLGRAFKLPLKKEKGCGGGVDEELDWDALSEESVGFIMEFVSDWVLLHEDTWMMPNEVINWVKVIGDGHPEKVDWAGLIWTMVEKELTQGIHLRNCYYASHLQYLMKFQLQEVFLIGGPTAAGTVELDAEPIEDDEGVNKADVMVGGVKDGLGGEGSFVDGPSTELTLGQDGENDEENKEVEMMDADEEGGGEDQRRWLLQGKKGMGEHFMQRCSVENDGGFCKLEGRKDEEEEEMEGAEGDEEAGNGVHVFPNDNALEEGDGLTGNLLQAMESTQIAYDSQEPSSMEIGADMHQMDPTPSFFNHSVKRVIEHDTDITRHPLNDCNKRLRLNDAWDHKPFNFETCVEQMQQIAERARMLYVEKEQSLEQSNMNQQILLSELQKRDTVIEHLHKTKLEEMQKKDVEIYRLERELYLMVNILDGYKRALKETQKVFAEYRERAQLPEEPVYKVAGPGGLMMSTRDIEKLHKKQEEEYKMNCLLFEQKLKEAEEDLVGKWKGYLEKIKILDKKLTGLEADAKEVTALYAKRKVEHKDEKVPEVTEFQPILGTKEAAPKDAETLVGE